MVGRWLALACITAWLFAARPANAQSADWSQPNQAAMDHARDLMNTGDAHMASNDYPKALAAYSQADDIMRVPTTRLWVCKTLHALGRLIEAHERCASVSGLGAWLVPEPDVFVAARDEARALTQTLAGIIPSLRIHLTGATTQVSVRIDGNAVSNAILERPEPVDPGEHVVEVVEGSRRAAASVTLSEREARTLDVLLPASPTPLPIGPVPPTGGSPDSSKSSLSPLAWIGFGIGGAGLIVGVVAGGVAASQASDVSDRCPENACDAADAALHDDYDAAVSTAHVSTAGFVVAGVGVALGIIGLLLPNEEATMQTAHVEPWITPLGGGLRGRF